MTNVVINIPDTVSKINKTSPTWLFNNKYILVFAIEICLVLYCIVCDYYIFKKPDLKYLINSIFGIDVKYVHALLDNASHAFIGLLACLLFELPNISIFNLLFAAFISSFIDIDHFIDAKSFDLNEATSLYKRPFMHNTLTMLIFNLLVFFLINYFQSKMKHISFIIFISWFTHHVRDANRHGLWFGSSYKTPPLSDYVYILITCLTPLAMKYVHSNI